MAIAFPASEYSELDVSLDPTQRALWCHLRPIGPPSFTRPLLADLQQLCRSVQTLFSGPRSEADIQFCVFASRVPGIFCMGGDLAHFVSCIRRQDREALRAYALDCVDVVHSLAVSFSVPIMTISLVQGDALGGGFEGALATDYIIAEKQANFGLPEILFNLFPGMGAYNLLARRIGPRQAERMILSGKVYTAAEMYDLGIIDQVVAEGEGPAAVRAFLNESRRNHGVHCAMSQIRRAVAPVTLEDLTKVTDIWIDLAMKLGATDLRRMEILVAAQARRLGKAERPQLD